MKLKNIYKNSRKDFKTKIEFFCSISNVNQFSIKMSSVIISNADYKQKLLQKYQTKDKWGGDIEIKCSDGSIFYNRKLLGQLSDILKTMTENQELIEIKYNLCIAIILLEMVEKNIIPECNYVGTNVYLLSREWNIKKIINRLENTSTNDRLNNIINIKYNNNENCMPLVINSIRNHTWNSKTPHRNVAKVLFEYYENSREIAMMSYNMQGQYKKTTDYLNSSTVLPNPDFSFVQDLNPLSILGKRSIDQESEQVEKKQKLAAIILSIANQK